MEADPRSRTASWSPSSCCSRPRCRGWSSSTIASSPSTPRSTTWRGPGRRGCGRAGRGWGTTGGRPTCTSWRRRWCASTTASFPTTPTGSRRCPGVGRYTATAVASFAFERPVATVDTNIARVIRRAFHPRRKPDPSDKVVWATAERLVPRRGGSGLGIQPGDHGAGSDGVYGEGGEVRDLPDPGCVQDGQEGEQGTVNRERGVGVP